MSNTEKLLKRFQDIIYAHRSEDHSNTIVSYGDVRLTITDMNTACAIIGNSIPNVANTAKQSPIKMRLRCPSCGEIHIDEPPWDSKPHHTHACQHCGEVWRPAIEDTQGVQFLPGFKNDED